MLISTYFVSGFCTRYLRYKERGEKVQFLPFQRQKRECFHCKGLNFNSLSLHSCFRLTSPRNSGVKRATPFGSGQSGNTGEWASPVPLGEGSSGTRGNWALSDPCVDEIGVLVISADTVKEQGQKLSHFQCGEH